MSWVKSALISAALAVFFVPEVALAVMCPDRVPAAVTLVSEDSLKCQKTISKEGEKFFNIAEA